MRWLLLLAAALCLVGVSCVTIATGLKYPNLDKMVVYSAPPVKDFKVIGTIGGTDKYMNDLLRDLKVKATRLNGSAIVIKSQSITQTEGDQQMINIIADVIVW